jgi:acyl dehydratase
MIITTDDHRGAINMEPISTLEESSQYSLDTGFRYPDKTVVITEEEQRRLHGWCDLDREIFGNVADPSLVGRLPVVMTSNTIISCRPDWGQVHTTHRIIQHRPILLGESLRVSGENIDLVPHARGEVLQSAWRYFDADGEVPFEVRPDGLLIDPMYESKRGDKRISRDFNRPEYVHVLTKQCTPEATVGYCEGTNNPIHSDVHIAKEFGFRAPIIAGTQTMSFLLEAVYRTRSPTSISLTINFKRPVFWDDELTVVMADREAGVQHIEAINSAGKCVADCLVDDIHH